MEHTAEREQPLLGMRILIVDDEFLIVLSIEDALRDAGAEVTSAATLPVALNEICEPSVLLPTLITELVLSTPSSSRLFWFCTWNAVAEGDERHHEQKPSPREEFHPITSWKFAIRRSTFNTRSNNDVRAAIVPCLGP